MFTYFGFEIEQVKTDKEKQKGAEGMKQAPIIVISCGFLLLVGSCSRSDPRLELDAYLSAVPDETRAKELLALSRQLDGALARHHQLKQDNRSRLQRLNADYDVTEDTLRQQVDLARAKLRVSRTAIIDIFAEMRESCSDEEWKRIAELQSQLMIDGKLKS